jgi:ABC-2 type transport system permease protein
LSVSSQPLAIKKRGVLMKIILHIGWKDLRVIFRDRAALILMLVAPFILTVAMGLVTGSLGSSSSGINQISVIVVNLDQSTLGNALVEQLKSPQLSQLLAVEENSDPAAAHAMVNTNKTAAVVIIPVGFTASVIPQTGQASEAAKQIEVYKNPSRSISAGVVQSIIEGFLNQVETGRIGGQVAVEQLIANGLVSPQGAAQTGVQIGTRLASDLGNLQTLTINTSQASTSEEPNLLMYLAPGFALLFLMYTVSLGGKTLLTERQEGTLTRLMTTPIQPSQVLVGKMTGTYMIGLAQMTILIGASFMLLGLSWGNPPALIILLITAVAAATGWGMLLAALSRNPGQVSSFGMAMTLLFGLLGGSFFGGTLPGVVGYIGMLTPNYWGQKGFNTLANGGNLMDLLPVYAALLVMAAILLVISVSIFRRKGLLQR